MEGEVEAVGEELSQHSHLVIPGGAFFAWCFGENFPSLTVDPCGSAGDRARIQIKGCGDHSVHGIVLRLKHVRALHAEVVGGALIPRPGGFYRGNFEGIELGRERRGDCKAGYKRKKFQKPCNHARGQRLNCFGRCISALINSPKSRPWSPSSPQSRTTNSTHRIAAAR